MSGPKVVRIVTREEILAICEGHLSRLAQALSAWQQQSKRLGQLDQADLAATQARHQQIRQLLVDNQLQQLQTVVPAEIEFLQRDLGQREERAVAALALQRQARRRLRENAATLLRALQVSDPAPDPQVLEKVKAIAAGRAMDDAESVLASGYASLVGEASAESLSDAQRSIATALQMERPSRWTAADHITRDPRLAHIDEHIARLQAVHGERVAEPFLQRLATVEHDADSGLRSMRLDTLVIDLAKVIAEHQLQRSRFATLQLLAAELAALPGHAGTALSARLADVLKAEAPDPLQIEQHTRECSEAIAQELNHRAAVARRRAVLEGLASLGYEVREGMETAWSEAGSVVVHKPATPGYGVEVGGRAESGRLQVRAVSLAGAQSRERDRDIETIWCGEFSRLRSLLADRGSELVIERALAIGEVPLKVIDVTADNSGRLSNASTKAAG